MFHSCPSSALFDLERSKIKAKDVKMPKLFVVITLQQIV